MKHISRFIASFILSISFYTIGYTQSSNFGVNLAGLEFGEKVLPGTPGKDYFVPTAAELDYYKSKGLTLIRIPFLWERIQPTLGGDLATTYLAKIDEVVAVAASRDMSIILDLHNYCRYPTKTGKLIGATGGPTVANFQDVWTKLAQHFADKPAVWAFDLMNEPHNMGLVSWQSIAQAGISAIRTTGDTRVIMVEGDNWSKGNSWKQYNNNLKDLIDPANNIIFAAHQYFDSDQSGVYTGNNITVTGAGANANTGVGYITPFVSWLNENNLKGMVGEYGVPNSGGDVANWNIMLTNFMNYLQENCVGGTYWAGGPAWGNYITSIEPTKSGSTYIDGPQMAVVANYTSLPSGCSLSSNNITVSVTAPLDKTTLIAGANTTVTADAATVDGTISKVDFYINSSLAGTSNTSPYSFNVENLTAGTYVVKAKATSSTNEVAASLAKTFYVAQPVYAATQTPVIDGKADVLWSNYPASNLNKVLLGTIPNSTFLSANWKATYDQTNLYVLVTVKDQTLVNSNAAVYNDDGIEIYFDNGNTKANSYGSGQFQYAFGWNDKKVYESIHNATTGVVFAQTNQGAAAGCTNNCAAQGYTMEVQIPWSTLGVSNPTPELFEGFEVMVNDDNTGTRVAKIAWTATTDNAWQDPSLMGTIILKDVPCTPTSINLTAESSTTFCKGHSAKLSTDLNSTNYQWYKNESSIAGATANTYYALTAGAYTVATLNNDNCISSAPSLNILVDSSETNAGPDQYITTTNTTLAGNAPFADNIGAWTILTGTGTFADASLYNTTVNGLSSGANTFVWTITSDSCGSSQDNVIINVGSKPTPSAITGSASINEGQSGIVYSFTPSDASDQIQWNVPTGASYTTNGNNTQITVDFGSSTGGIVSVTENNLYGSTTQQMNVSITTAVLGAASGTTYTVMPNPFQTSSVIVVNSTHAEPVSITITDLNGLIVSTYSKEAANTGIVIGENLSAGIYLVRIQQGSEYSIFKLIKI